MSVATTIGTAADATGVGADGGADEAAGGVVVERTGVAVGAGVGGIDALGEGVGDGVGLGVADACCLSTCISCSNSAMRAESVLAVHPTSSPATTKPARKYFMAGLYPITV